MEMKRKIMAIWVILLLVAIPIGVAQASESNDREQNNETVSVELITFESDEILSTETVVLSKEDLIELENIISILIVRIQSAKNWEEIEGIINNLPKTNGVILSIIFKILSKFRLSRSRAFVISSGHGYKLNPFKKSELKIRKKFTFWHYSSGKIIKDRTIYFQPLAFKMKILKGIQFGFMTRFTGIYIFVARKLPEKSYTFFLGTAHRIKGIQILSTK
jgi:hypothetical protein